VGLFSLYADGVSRGEIKFVGRRVHQGSCKQKGGIVLPATSRYFFKIWKGSEAVKCSHLLFS
jgi:hypothetical protein